MSATDHLGPQFDPMKFTGYSMSPYWNMPGNAKAANNRGQAEATDNKYGMEDMRETRVSGYQAKRTKTFNAHRAVIGQN